MPTIGASGAIAGVMGAYMIQYPRSRILTLIPIFLFFPIVEVPAVFFLGVWFIFQFLSAAGSAGQGGIAWWAHIGGFIFGIIFLKMLLSVKRTSIGQKARQITKKRTSDRIQVIRPVSLGHDPHRYGTITVTGREARSGTRKLVNIPEGLKKRTYVLVIPPGTTEGAKLRLSGLGRLLDNGERGDLFLKVQIED
jgi:hypothetical protein